MAICEEALTVRIPPVLDYLESLVGDGDGIIGGRFSIADIAVTSPFVNFSHAGESVDATRWPRLAAYLERARSRPSFKKLIDEEAAAFASL